MPVPKFFTWILTWSPQIFRTPKLTPLCIFGRSGMVASHLWLYGAFAHGTISTSDEMWGMRDMEPTQRLYRGHLHYQLCVGRDLIPTAASVPHEWLAKIFRKERRSVDLYIVSSYIKIFICTFKHHQNHFWNIWIWHKSYRHLLNL